MIPEGAEVSVIYSGSGTLELDGGDLLDPEDNCFTMPETDAWLGIEVRYAITDNTSDTGGTFDVPTSEPEGGIVTITVTPEENWSLKADSLKAEYTEGGETKSCQVTAVSTNDNVYTFTMPAAAVTVSAEMEELPFDIGVSDSIANGTIGVTVGTVAGATQAPFGKTVTLTLEPDTGYALAADSLKVTYLESSVTKSCDLTPDSANPTSIPSTCPPRR